MTKKKRENDELSFWNVMNGWKPLIEYKMTSKFDAPVNKMQTEPYSMPNIRRIPQNMACSDTWKNDHCVARIDSGGLVLTHRF